MAVNYDLIVNGNDANAANFNSPLQQLDDAIENIKDGTAAMSAPQITSHVNSTHDHSDAANGGKVPFDELDTTGETVGNLLAVGSSNNVVTVADKWEVGDILPKAKVSDSSNLWLRLDGRTVGNADSGGTARANVDMEDLFLHLWTEFTNSELVIQNSSGTPTTRLATAALDWADDKRLPLPDGRGKVLAGMDDPSGSDPANIVTDSEADAMGGSMGEETHQLVASEIPAHTHTTTVPVRATTGGTPITTRVGSSNSLGSDFVINIASTSIGSSGTHNNMQPTLFINYFIYTGN